MNARKHGNGNGSGDERGGMDRRAGTGASSPARLGRGLALPALLVAAGFAAGSLRAGAWTSEATAEPPRPSALNMQRGGVAGDPAELLDAGAQRLAIVAELKALRAEVGDLRTMLSTGRAKVEVANLDAIGLEIDYARLREALRDR
jgi:hypothetical protein